MADERRYGEDEVRAIFDAAARRPDAGGGRVLEAGEGLTLAELQEIGGEVGMSRERIAEAARALDARGVARSKRTLFGAPLSVGRTVELPRAPTDREWEMLVAELRQTFDAGGEVAGYGGSREWRKGNLHAYVEPTESGHRLRLGTHKGDAVALSRMGTALVVLALAVVVALLAVGELADGFFAPLLLGAIGGAFIGSAVLGLPRWARTRERQMEHVAARALALLGPPDSPGEDDRA